MANFLSASRKPSSPRATSRRAPPSPFLFTAGFSVIILVSWRSKSLSLRYWFFILLSMCIHFAGLSLSRAVQDRSGLNLHRSIMDFEAFSVLPQSSVWFVFSCLQLLAAGCHGAPFTNRKGGKSSVFSLFNLKSKSKFWSEKVIHGGEPDPLLSFHSFSF